MVLLQKNQDNINCNNLYSNSMELLNDNHDKVN